MTEISGRKCSALLPRSGRGGCLEKMSLVLLTFQWASTECFLTWKVKGTTRGHLRFQLVPSTPRSGGAGFGSWPSPTASDHLASQSETLGAWEERAAKKKAQGINLQFALRHAVQMWPTPNVPNGGRSPAPGTVSLTGKTLDGKKRQVDLGAAVKAMWSTLRASDGAHGGPNQRDSKGRLGLTGEAAHAKMWPTPNTRDTGRGCNQKQLATEVDKAMWATPRAGSAMATPNLMTVSNRTRDRGNLEEQVGMAMWSTPMTPRGHDSDNTAGRPYKSKKQFDLAAAAMWGTLTARDHKDGTSVENVPVKSLLGRQVQPSKDAGSLNPDFVEWVMGFPAGWTRLS